MSSDCSDYTFQLIEKGIAPVSAAYLTLFRNFPDSIQSSHLILD